MTEEQLTILNLVAKLRQMDQLVFRMSQCLSWEQMRPIFNELLAEANGRMSEESDRIRLLLVPEIVRTYAKRPEEAPIPGQPPRLEGPGHEGPTEG